MAQIGSAEKARTVSRMFGRIAGRYDAGNRILSLGRDQAWRRKTAKLLNPQAAHVVLDVGAGTGDLTLGVAPKAHEVVGLDLSVPMLAIGRLKAGKAIAHNTEFIAGDALRLPFAAASFDGLTTAFTVRNLAKMEQGFAEFYRVLKPGGRMVCLEFTQPRSSVVHFVYRPYLSTVLPFLGGWVSGDKAAYRYLASSINAFPTASTLGSVITGAGFKDVQWHFLNFGTVAIHWADKPRTTAEMPLPQVA